MEIATAIITGIFSMAGIFLSHYLNTRTITRSSSTSPTEQPLAASDVAVVETPVATGELQSSADAESVKTSRSLKLLPTKSREVPLLLWLAVFPHAIFGIALFHSTDGDAAVSYLWFANSLVLAIGAIGATTNRARSHFVAFLAAVGQTIVMFGMLSLIKEANIATIVAANLPVAAVLAIMGFFYSFKSGKVNDALDA